MFKQNVFMLILWKHGLIRAKSLFKVELNKLQICKPLPEFEPDTYWPDTSVLTGHLGVYPCASKHYNKSEQKYLFSLSVE